MKVQCPDCKKIYDTTRTAGYCCGHWITGDEMLVVDRVLPSEVAARKSLEERVAVLEQKFEMFMEQRARDSR